MLRSQTCTYGVCGGCSLAFIRDCPCFSHFRTFGCSAMHACRCNYSPNFQIVLSYPNYLELPLGFGDGPRRSAHPQSPHTRTPLTLELSPACGLTSSRPVSIYGPNLIKSMLAKVANPAPSASLALVPSTSGRDVPRATYCLHVISTRQFSVSRHHIPGARAPPSPRPSAAGACRWRCHGPPALRRPGAGRRSGARRRARKT